MASLVYGGAVFNNPDLKPNESLQGGEGMFISRYITGQRNNPKSGSSAVSVPVYSKVQQAPAAAAAAPATPAPQAAPPPPPPPQFQPSPQLQALNREADALNASAEANRASAKDLADAWNRGQGLGGASRPDVPSLVANEGQRKVDDYEFRFLPSKRLQVAREALEIGEATRHNTARLPSDLKLPENLDSNRLTSLLQSLKGTLG